MKNTSPYQLALDNYVTRVWDMTLMCNFQILFQKNAYFSVTGIHHVSLETNHFIFMNSSGARVHKMSIIIFCQNHNIVTVQLPFREQRWYLLDQGAQL